MRYSGKSETKNGHLAVFGLAACLLSIFGCTSTQDTSANDQGSPVTLTIGVPNIAGQDPLRGIQQAARLISLDGLVGLNRDGHAAPKLAEHWKASDDGLTWTIQLRSNAYFHDNSPVTSLSVKDSLERAIAGTNRDLSPGLADIARIETAGDHTLVILLHDRSTFLLDDLTVPITKIGPGKVTLGAGPYAVRSASDDQIAMDAFPRYYRGKPTIDRVVWKPYPTVRTAWAAMMRGEVDFLYEVGQEAREFIEAESSIEIFPFLRSFVYAIVPNSRNPAFQDPRVRRALSHAIDREGLVERAFRGHGRPASGGAWPEHWAFDSTLPGLGQDQARASALLNSVGLRPVSDIPGRPPAKIHFTCIFPENLPLWERMGLIAQRNLAEIGVDMQLEALPISQFNERLASKRFDAVLLELVVGNSPTRPYFFWHSGSGPNVWEYNNPVVDKALDGIRRARNDIDYRTAFHAFQVSTLENPPAIFLALGETTRAVSRRFRVVAPPGSDILPTIADWHLAVDTARNTN